MIIILFIIYLILLLWIFDFIELKDSKKINNDLNYPTTIIINNVSDIKKLLATLDSIKSTHYKQKLELIIIHSSNDDIRLITSPYNTIFQSVHIIKAEYYDFDPSIINFDNILIIQNGIQLSPDFINIIQR